jgi:hypothetical protein
MALQFRYYDPSWRRDTFQCPSCTWSGSSADMTPEYFQELQDFSCPSCDARLLIVSYPTLDDIKAAARDGNAEAQAELARFMA